MPATQQDPLRVVLVEDHPLYLEQLKHLLEELGGVRVVHCAKRSRDAVAWIGRHREGWDLLVLDIFLAEGHGFEVLRACRDRGEGQHAVFLTSYTRDPARSQALALGADAVFDKTDIAGFLGYAGRCRDGLRQPART